MSAKPKKSARMGKRYTDAEKNEVVSYVQEFNNTNGRGGQASAVKKFGVTALTITAWSKAAGKSKPAKTAAPKTAKKAAAPKVAKKAAKKVTAKKAVKKTAKKAVKKAAAKPVKKTAVKVVRKGRNKAPQGTRYTEAQKQAVLDYVASVNAKKGRGGMSAAAKKFKVTPLTVSTWIRKYEAGTTGRKTSVAASVDTAKLLAKLAKAEAIIASIKAKLG